ncbi:MAG: Holliday junction resolvase RuvX [Anaeromyxobacteraceae bacterium]
MRYLGIDVGRARIGVAIADGLLRTSRPLQVVERRGDVPDLAAIAAVAAEYEVTQAVVGLPLNMDGSEGPSADFARRFAGKLADALNVPVAFQDERLSTFEAAARMRERGISAKEGRATIDAEAAAVILQDWLDGSNR